MGWFSGKKGKYKQVSTLTKEQQPLQSELVNAGSGAFNDVGDYYRGNLSNDPQDMQAFAAPELRKFNEEIIPGLSNQFAGMGAGDSGLTGSSFRNAAVNAGTDLAERLGSIRANLRQQSAQGLQQLGEQGLKPTVENIYEPGTGGFGDMIAPAIGKAAAAFAGNPAAAISAGSQLFNSFGGKKVGANSDPYGRNASSNRGSLPSFSNKLAR